MAQCLYLHINFLRGPFGSATSDHKIALSWDLPAEAYYSFYV